MGFRVQSLWETPEINPVNHKARSIPILNPFTNVYGRVFFFGWFGFMIAFWSWYAFPPLLSLTIAGDIHASTTDVANSNIVGLCATLIVRVIAGPLCDLIGPRYTFAACLLAGAIPTALAGCVFNAPGLLALRFFIGILGGSFVPCQVWSTGFFDKNVVGTANALAGGWGNAGGGITYFVMPAVFDSLVHSRGLSAHVAWRVSFIVPFILIVTTAIGLVALCPDTPTGKWSERHLHVAEALQAHGVSAESAMVTIPGGITEKPASDGASTPTSADEKALRDERNVAAAKHNFDHEAAMKPEDMVETARGEVVEKPTFAHALGVIMTPQTLVVAMCYFCSFGPELAINSILGAYYYKNFKTQGFTQSISGNWAAMFGLLNVVFRPLGGFVSDFLYRRTKSVWAKKIWMHFLAVVTGCFLIAIGVLDSHNQSTMFGLVAGMAFFLEAGNGANFSLVPHVWPANNGIISGIVGAAGNFGGIIFAIIFRYEPMMYGKVFWIIGVMIIAINLCICWIPPVNKRQIGGR